MTIEIDADSLVEAKRILPVALEGMPEVSVYFQPIEYYIPCEPDIEDEVIGTYLFLKTEKEFNVKEVIIERTLKDV